MGLESGLITSVPACVSRPWRQNVASAWLGWMESTPGSRQMDQSFTFLNILMLSSDSCDRRGCVIDVTKSAARRQVTARERSVSASAACLSGSIVQPFGWRGPCHHKSWIDHLGCLRPLFPALLRRVNDSVEVGVQGCERLRRFVKRKSIRRVDAEGRTARRQQQLTSLCNEFV